MPPSPVVYNATVRVMGRNDVEGGTVSRLRCWEGGRAEAWRGLRGGDWGTVGGGEEFDGLTVM